jgi:hypothetical protein
MRTLHALDYSSSSLFSLPACLLCVIQSMDARAEQIRCNRVVYSLPSPPRHPLLLSVRVPVKVKCNAWAV